MFCFRYADRSTNHGWCFTPTSDHAQPLLSFLCEMGRLTWAEIERHRTGVVKRHRKHHDQLITSIDSDAQQDLARLKLDEIFGDSIFRFRLTGTQRLWGFRADRTFHVIWWDPEHHVCPSEPD